MQSLPKQSLRKVRAPRVSVPNNEPVKVAVGSKQFVGTLGRLSCTGGSIRLPKQLAPGTMADFTLRTAAGKVDAAIELLAHLNASPGLQAFRFVQIDVPDMRRLEGALLELRKQGFGETKGWGLSMLLQTAQRTFTALTS